VKVPRRPDDAADFADANSVGVDPKGCDGTNPS